MEEVKVNNYAMLRGTLAQAPCFSHENRGERFYQFPLEVLRLSGAGSLFYLTAYGAYAAPRPAVTFQAIEK